MLAAVFVPQSASAGSGACSPDQIRAGLCKIGGEVLDGSANLEAEYESIAVANPTDRGPADEDTPDDRIPADVAAPVRPLVPTLDFCSPTDPTDCTFTGAEPEPPPAGSPAVTLRDIASFRPAAPGDAMEPGGWAVVGLPANFVAEASVQTLSGTLLGRSADVRFHPVAYRWAHSDGATVQSSVPGSTWEELGHAEFTETATSHVYATSGEYTVDVAATLRAEYRFAGSPWRAIAGTLTVAGAQQRVLVGEFDTVLTQGDCNARPDAPGC